MRNYFLNKPSKSIHKRKFEVFDCNYLKLFFLPKRTTAGKKRERYVGVERHWQGQSIAICHPEDNFARSEDRKKGNPIQMFKEHK